MKFHGQTNDFLQNELQGVVLEELVGFPSGAKENRLIIKDGIQYRCINDTIDTTLPEAWTEIGSDNRYILRTCEASAAVKDVVYPDPGTNGHVLVNTDNREDTLSVGIIEEKLSSTLAKILVGGDSGQTFTGMNRANKVYIGTDGKPTIVLPTTGYVHIIGACHTNARLYVNIGTTRVKRNPF